MVVAVVEEVVLVDSVLGCAAAAVVEGEVMGVPAPESVAIILEGVERGKEVEKRTKENRMMG